jgi:hypothetical protein
VTVIARRVVSSPVRTAAEAWGIITNILAPKEGTARTELSKVAGVACSLIASEAPTDDAIVIWGSGPRVRVYCLFGDGAISGEDRNEDALASCPTESNWFISFPCPPEDLAWVRKELAGQSTRISARKLGDSVPEEEPQTDQEYKSNLETAVNEDAFFRS